MATVIRSDEVTLLQSGNCTHVRGFFADGEVRHTRDLTTTYQLIDLVVEVADVLHLAVHLQQVFFFIFSHNDIYVVYFDLCYAVWTLYHQ